MQWNPAEPTGRRSPPIAEPPGRQQAQPPLGARGAQEEAQAQAEYEAP